MTVEEVVAIHADQIGPTVDIGVGGSTSASLGGASISADQKYTDIGRHAGLLLFL